MKKNLPVPCVDDLFWRKKSKHEYKFKKTTVIGTMFEMCVDVEAILSYDMKKAGRGGALSSTMAGPSSGSITLDCLHHMTRDVGLLKETESVVVSSL